MKQKIFTILMIILCGMMIAACNEDTTVIDKDYILNEEPSTAQKQQIDLEQYRIQEGSMISLKGLIDVSDLSMESVCFYDDNHLILLYADKSYTRLDTYLFSLEDGGIEWYGSVDGLAGYGDYGVNYKIVNIQPLVIMEESSRCLWVIKDKKVSLKIDLSEYNCQSLVTNNLGVYFTNDKANALEYISFTSGEREQILYDMDTYSYSIRSIVYADEEGKLIYACGVNKFTLEDTTFVINTEKKEVVANTPGVYEFWEDGKILYSSSVKDFKYIVKRRSGDKYTEVTETYLLPEMVFDYCIPNDNCVITEENDGMSYTFSYYDMDTMTLNNLTTMNFGSYFSYEYATECEFTYCYIDKKYAYNEKRNMLVLEVTTDVGYSGVFLWDINSSETINDTLDVVNYTDESATEYINETLYATLSDDIHAIYDKYGVGIYVGSNSPKDFLDFSALNNDNIYDMTNAVAEIKKALSSYPENFFEYFSTDDYLSGINIYLVGSITPTSEGYISEPAGFTNTYQNFEVIVLDINYAYNIEKTMYHEISHIIYKRIEYEEAMDEVDYFDIGKWNGLNPSGFEYYNAYLDENGQDYSIVGGAANTGDAYTGKDDLDDMYFIDPYSKTFLKEDIARLMEYSMGNPDWELLQSPHIVSKLNYYYGVIRAVWDTKGWPKQTIWESNVYKEQ